MTKIMAMIEAVAVAIIFILYISMKDGMLPCGLSIPLNRTDRQLFPL